jgi:hypothetical protein
VNCGPNEKADKSPEIEITPEMIEAGAAVLREHAGIYSSWDGVEGLLAELVLKAALRAASAGRA